MCGAHSVVCAGGETANWWNRSIFLSSHQITDLQMNEQDKQLLLEILKMKLSTSAIESMKLYDNTNKNEAMHRSVSANLPKNVQWSATMEGRVAATVHRSNNSPGTSTKIKCDSFGIKLSNPTIKFLDKLDRDFEYQKGYQKRDNVQQRKLQQKAENLTEHKTFKELNKERCVDVYKKDHLDKALQDHASCLKKRLV